ncbi:MAG: hypothetical protein D6784_12785 [Chloroflexi bacterium]|nr:MAG: hypothetical protein D6784_12785 [Chloroflexota bacterium]
MVIELPDGDKYGKGDDVEIRITVRDSDGVKNFEWGVFTQNGVSVKGGNKDCGNAGECSTKQEFNAALDGVFQIGVKAYDSANNETVEVKQVYVGG